MIISYFVINLFLSFSFLLLISVQFSCYLVYCLVTPCTINPCLNQGQCQMSGNTFQCICDLGFSGVTCESELYFVHRTLLVIYCCQSSSKPICRNKTLLSSFMSFHLLMNLDNPCLNQGQCQISGNTFQCVCNPGFSGVTCESEFCLILTFKMKYLL